MNAVLSSTSGLDTVVTDIEFLEYVVKLSGGAKPFFCAICNNIVNEVRDKNESKRERERERT